jgi:ABC-type antimicrobial peptide transport system permease subunit
MTARSCAPWRCASPAASATDLGLRLLRPDAARTRWLVASPDPATAALVLRRRLAPYGVEVTSTAEAIAALGAVRTAYLDAFLALGGVGLGFAVLGMAALVLRSAEERRWEVALLSALGLARRRWAVLLAGEHILLLVVGMALGSAAALLVSLSALTAPGATMAWSAVGLVLGGVLLLGVLLALLAGCWGARHQPARTLAAER